MAASTGAYVIAGAGMTGMMAALLLSKRIDPKRIVIIDSADAPGGNYRPVDYGARGTYDQGMRMLYETGYRELDALIRGILPEDAWHVLPGNEKDIAGIYWQGALQTHSPYIDLRQVNNVEACKTELLRSIAANLPEDATNAKTWLTTHFGEPAAAYLCDVLEKLHALPVHWLDVMAISQPAMNRVVLLDEAELRPQLQNEALRARVAWPDQLTMPKLRASEQAGLYPKKYGMQSVIDALEKQLTDAGVTFIFKDAIASLEHKNGLSLRTVRGAQLEDIAHLYWTGSMHALARLTGAKAQPLPAPQPAMLVHLCIPEPVAMEKLYHFYCYDAPYHTFRLTHYAGYCPDAKRPEGYPVCLELWNIQSDDEELAVQTALSEIVALGIAPNAESIYVCGVTRTPNLHGYCTKEAVGIMNELRGTLTTALPDSITLLGAFAEEGQMLLYEVWRDMYRKIKDRDGAYA